MANERRERRTKKQIITDKIAKVNEKIDDLKAKLTAAEGEKAELQKELDDMAAAEAKAAREEQMQDLLNVMNEKNLSVDDLKTLLEKAK